MATSIARKMTDISVEGGSLYHEWIARTTDRREGHIGRRKWKCGVRKSEMSGRPDLVLWVVVGCNTRFVIVTYSYIIFTSRSDIFWNRTKIYVLFLRIPNVWFGRTKLLCLNFGQYLRDDVFVIYRYWTSNDFVRQYQSLRVSTLNHDILPALKYLLTKTF